MCTQPLLIQKTPVIKGRFQRKLSCFAEPQGLGHVDIWETREREFSGVSSSCGARGGFLTRQDEDLREPLVRCQGSQVSVHVVRGSASWLSSHGRGLGPPDALKKDTRGLSGVAAGKPRFPRLLPGT